MSTENNSVDKLVFGKANYAIMLIGILIIATGYLLMIGGAPVDKNVFNEAELYSPIRITVAPILIVLGLLIQIPAILYSPKAD